MIFVWGWVNSSSFTKIVKDQISGKGGSYEDKALENPRNYIMESDTITPAAFRHAILNKSLMGMKFLIHATKDLCINWAITDSIIEEILCTFDTKQAGDIFKLMVERNIMLENEDEKSK